MRGRESAGGGWIDDIDQAPLEIKGMEAFIFASFTLFFSFFFIFKLP